MKVFMFGILCSLIIDLLAAFLIKSVNYFAIGIVIILSIAMLIMGLIKVIRSKNNPKSKSIIWPIILFSGIFNLVFWIISILEVGGAF